MSLLIVVVVVFSFNHPSKSKKLMITDSVIEKVDTFSETRQIDTQPYYFCDTFVEKLGSDECFHGNIRRIEKKNARFEGFNVCMNTTNKQSIVHELDSTHFS